MHQSFAILVKRSFIVSVFLLSACGSGGGGGGGGGGNSAVSPALTFSPSGLVETIGAGDSITLAVKATPASGAINGPVYIVITDNMGTITSNVSITPNGDGTYTATLETSPSLSVGHHQGNIQVRLCVDAACSSQYPGSPIPLPYDLNIVSATNLTPLVAWPAIGDWETFQRNAAHSGYVPVTLDPAQFTPRWSWSTPESGNKLHPVVVANGIVYAASSGYARPSSTIYALQESDSGAQWQFGFGAVFQLNPPAVSAGKVYIATSGHSDTYFWSFNATNGAKLSQVMADSQWDSYNSPVINLDMVYSPGGTFGGMYGFNFADGSSRWYLKISFPNLWAPAADATYLYTYHADGLNVFDRSTGSIVYHINDAGAVWPGLDLFGAPVLGSNNAVIITNGQGAWGDAPLSHFDLALLSRNWSIPGRYVGNPAVANGVIYVMNASPYQLEARSESTGDLLWSWQPTRIDETKFQGSVVTTDNIVFVSTNKRVYAIDVHTHQPVWSYWRPGQLAISANGVLYVTTGSKLGAVNLK